MNGRLLVLFGNNGAAKTHCMRSVYRWWFEVGRLRQFVRSPDVITVPRAESWSWPALLDAFKNGSWHLVEQLCQCELVLLDELGAGYDPNRMGVDKLHQVLSAREFKWTIVSTNLKPEEWEEAFDRRIASRLNRGSTVLDLSDVPDFSSVNV